MRKYIRLGSLYIRHNINIKIPSDLVVKFNIVMKKLGFGNAQSFIVYLIRREVERFLEKHPEAMDVIREYERLYSIREKGKKG